MADKTVVLYVYDGAGWHGYAKSPEEAACMVNAIRNRRWLRNRPWWDKALDRVSFLLMDVAAWVDRMTWRRQRYQRRLEPHVHDVEHQRPQHPGAYPVKYWCTCNDFTVLVPDGWRPGRYV